MIDRLRRPAQLGLGQITQTMRSRIRATPTLGSDLEVTAVTRETSGSVWLKKADGC